MSWQASGWAKKIKLSPTGKKITKAEKFLLLTMADDFVENRGYAEVSVKGLAENTESTKRQVRRILRRLESAGWIETIIGGPGRLNLYRFSAYRDGVKITPGDKKQHGVKITPQVGSKCPQDISDMGTFPVGKEDISSISPSDSPSYLKTDKTSEEGGEPASATISLTWQKEDYWLKDFLKNQQALAVPAEYLLDNPAWWTSVGLACGGLDLPWLNIELSKLEAHLIEEPEKRPQSRRDWLKKIRQWLIRENRWREEEKRAGAQKRKG